MDSTTSVRDLHHLTAAAVARHAEVHRAHHHVAHKVAGERRAAGLHVAPSPLHLPSGTAAAIEGSSPPQGSTS